MKRLLFSRLAVVILFSAAFYTGFTQQLSSYVYSYSTATKYTPITGTTLVSGVGAFDDTVFTNVPIGFTFYYEGNPYTTVGVSSNGFIWFGNGTASKSEYNPISDPSNNLGGTGTVTGAAGYAADLEAYPFALIKAPTNGPFISYTTTGAAGSYVFTVQWQGLYNKNDDSVPGTYTLLGVKEQKDRLDMQVILTEATNSITIYPDIYPFPYIGKTHAEVGLRGASNTDFANLDVDNCNNYNWASPGLNISDTATGIVNAEPTGLLTGNTCYPAKDATYTWTPPVSVSCPLKITSNTSTNLTCNNSDNGTITIVALDTVTTTTLTYTINAGSNISNTTGDFTGLSAGTYTVSVSNGSCSITGKSDTLVNPAAVPSPTASNTGPYCTGGTLQLNATTVAGATYHWTGPNSFTSGQQDTSLANITVIDSGNYSVVATVGGCSSAAGTTHVVVVASLTPPVLNSNSPVCLGDTLEITASNGGSTYSWTGPNGYVSSSQNPVITNVSFNDSGYYKVVVSSGNCSAPADSIRISVNPVPAEPQASSNSPVCTGSTLNLFATTVAGPVTYNWSGPGNYSSNQQNPSIPGATVQNTGSYSVYASLGGCKSAVSSVAVSVSNAPVLSGAVSNSPVCAADTLNLAAPSLNGASYNWTGPNGFSDTAQNPFVANISATDSGEYFVVAHIGTCTTAPDTVTVTVNPLPQPPVLTSAYDTICSGDSVQVCAPNTFASYAWSNGTSANSCTFANYAGGYWVTVTDANSCSVISQHKNIYVYPVSSVSILEDGDTLIAYGGIAYQWFRNDTLIKGATNSLYIVPVIGEYSVQLTDSNGCIASSSDVNVTKVSVGITDLSDGYNFNIYPNPASGSFNIVYAGAGDKSVQLSMYNILGQGVKQENLSFGNGKNRTVDISDLPKGVYLLQFIQQGGQLLTKKLVVQ